MSGPSTQELAITGLGDSPRCVLLARWWGVTPVGSLTTAVHPGIASIQDRHSWASSHRNPPSQTEMARVRPGLTSPPPLHGQRPFIALAATLSWLGAFINSGSPEPLDKWDPKYDEAVEEELVNLWADYVEASDTYFDHIWGAIYMWSGLCGMQLTREWVWHSLRSPSNGKLWRPQRGKPWTPTILLSEWLSRVLQSQEGQYDPTSYS